MWSLLLLTLPTRPNAVRLRVWRALKGLGCAALRDGAYLLPASAASALEPLAAEVRQHHGSAELLRVQPTGDDQAAAWRAMFDRGADYMHWQRLAAELRDELAALSETEARRRLRALADALASLLQIDYFAGAAAAQAEDTLSALRLALDARFSRDEPHPVADQRIARLDPARFQGRCWATRSRPWVDRLASAWLIRRFIDPQARFVWLAEGAKPPRGALGFDFDGARFTHVGTRVSFEVLCVAFGLDGDAALRRLGSVVHHLDVGGIPAPESAGLESVLAGLRALHADDDRLLAAAAAVFDALHAAPASRP